MRAGVGFLKCHSNEVRRGENPAMDRRVVELSSSGRCCHPSDDQPWITGSSSCRQVAAVIRRTSGCGPPGYQSVAIWTLPSVAPFGHQPPGRRCRLLSCPCQNTTVITCTSGRGSPGCRSASLGRHRQPLSYCSSVRCATSTFVPF